MKTKTIQLAEDLESGFQMVGAIESDGVVPKAVCRVTLPLTHHVKFSAVQNSSIGDLVTD